ncbi:MAG: hypothetical protein K0Q53_923 [Massilibacillus sp.]|nr:hypothetical protein [Massilibacillus sp.]
MAGIKNEVQTIREYNAYFRMDFFLSLQCNGSSDITADSEKSYFYHSSGRTLAECLQK